MVRIGFNNSHQTEPVVINREDETPLVVFTQWEHQDVVNRFSLWKMQIDGSDEFMFYGDEATTDDSEENLYQARQVQSGKYKGYILMGQAARLNACNQCHQDRNQDNIDLYKDYYSIAHHKMKGDLSSLFGTDKDITDYNASEKIPDFHKDVMPLLTKAGLNGGQSCVDCHNATDKLNLANSSGVSMMNTTYRNLILGAHKVEGSENVLPYLYGGINPMGDEMDDHYHPAPFLWSLMLGDDLSVEADDNHSNTSARSLEREGDYGAQYNQEVIDEVARINTLYDHSKHWSLLDTQKMINYGVTRLLAGLSDRSSFVSDSLSTSTAQGQKAYQALVKNCYVCHNTHTTGGLRDENFDDIIPLEKRFRASYYLRDSTTRFAVYRYLANKGDTKYSPYLWQSNLNYSRHYTLNSALHRIDFNDLNNSELLVYARGYYKQSDGTQIPLNDSIKTHEPLDESSTDYKAIENWINGVSMINSMPTIDAPSEPIVIKEYDDPAYIDQNITWSDADTLEDGSEELSQAFITDDSGREVVYNGKQTFVVNEDTDEHTFNDTMLALEYNNFKSAKLKTYAILGDRGDQNFTFTVNDGLNSASTTKIPVTVTSDYVVPRPSETLPDAYLFFTDRNSSMLKKLETNGTVTDVGLISGFSDKWTTVYRRSDKGWLYFVNQETQTIHVVDETTAQVLFDITLDHEPNRVGTNHKQTVYLIWWRPAEGTEGEEGYRPGELQALLESKLSSEAINNGDFYVSLGNEESDTAVVVPEWRTKLPDGGNTIGVYVWKRATFMTKWVNEGVDRLSVLNLETAKPKFMTDFNFTAQSIESVDYNASVYWNVRAITVAEDGAFYGFNKDLNTDPEVFNFDPILGIQKKVNVPEWIQEYINNYTNYSTPFLVIEPRNW